ncbi:MAG: PilZ domain-containing protein [Clostridiales bacterium]|nr:PilZ domain-containing protein [Clostridiales bacterium]
MNETESGRGEKLNLDFLQPGQAITVYQMDTVALSSVDKHYLEGRILSVTGQRDFSAVFHLQNFEQLYFFRSEQLTVRHSSVFQAASFVCRVLSCQEGKKEDAEREAPVVTVKFRGLTLVVMDQRREFFRLPVNVPVYYRMLGDGDERERRNTEEYVRAYSPYDKAFVMPGNACDYCQTVSIDLSGGGLRCRLCRQPLAGEKVLCRLSLGKESLPLVAQVVRMNPLDASGIYDVSAAFDGLSDMIRNRIIRFIFEQQMEMLNSIQSSLL